MTTTTKRSGRQKAQKWKQRSTSTRSRRRRQRGSVRKADGGWGLRDVFSRRRRQRLVVPVADDALAYSPSASTATAPSSPKESSASSVFSTATSTASTASTAASLDDHDDEAPATTTPEAAAAASTPPPTSQFRVTDATIRAMVAGYFAGTLPPEAADMSNWDVSAVTDMSNLFNGQQQKTVIPPLNAWKVDAVQNFAFMFAWSSFDQDLDRWNVSAATRFTGMFMQTRAFNRPLNSWNVVQAKHLDFMFAFTAAFDQPLDRWNVSAAENMDGMFLHAEAFNQDIDAWNVRNVRTMSRMFARTARFNRPLPSWKQKVNAVLDFSYMFAESTSFDRENVADWPIHRDADTREMFGTYARPMQFKGFTHTVRPADMSKIAPAPSLPTAASTTTSTAKRGTLQEKVQLFLANNPDHLVFQWRGDGDGSSSSSSSKKDNNKVAFTTRGELREYCFVQANIVFACHAPGRMRRANIDATTPYLDLRRVSLGPGPVPVAEINHVLARPSIRAVRVDDGPRRLAAVASVEAMAFGDPSATAARCQAETGTQAYALTVLVFPASAPGAALTSVREEEEETIHAQEKEP